MKKKTVVKLSLVLCLLLCMSLVACDNDVKDEPHKAKSEWSSNGTEHWRDCATEGCTEKFEKVAHTFGDWEITITPSYGKQGEQKRVCSVCGYGETITLAALEAKDNAVALKTGVAKSKTYDGKGIALSADDFTRNGDGAITFAYRVKGSEEAFSNEAPKNAGVYEVKVSVAATAEWKECETTVEYEIEKKELEFEDSTLSKEYDGTARYTHVFTEADGLISGDECTYSFGIYDYYGKEEYINAGSYSDLTYQSEIVSNDNYSVNNTGLSDPQGTTLEITKKKVGGLSFETDVDDEEGGETSITREIDGVEGEKITVVISFMQSWLSRECSLTLSTDGTADGTCKIVFKEPENVKNYTFGDDIGTLFLIGG